MGRIIERPTASGKMSCDHCGEQVQELFNTPTELGPWANLCIDCMLIIGIMTSVTEHIKVVKL